MKYKNEINGSTVLKLRNLESFSYHTVGSPIRATKAGLFTPLKVRLAIPCLLHSFSQKPSKVISSPKINM